MLKELESPPVLALTAIATPDVVRDIEQQLALPHLTKINLGVYRENLRYEVFAETNDHEKQTRIDQLLKELDGTGLIYCAIIKNVELVNAY